MLYSCASRLVINEHNLFPLIALSEDRIIYTIGCKSKILMSFYRFMRESLAQTCKLLLLHQFPPSLYEYILWHIQSARMINLAYLRPFNCHRNYIYTNKSIINSTVYASNERVMETSFLNMLQFSANESGTLCAWLIKLLSQPFPSLSHPVKQHKLRHMECN